MPRTARPKTLDDVFHAQQFLSLAHDVDLSDSCHTIPSKRAILATCFGRNSKLNPHQTSEHQIHTAFRAIHDRYVGFLNSYERNPLPILLATEQQSVDNSLSEHIAIMLDSCTPEQLTVLTETFGAQALGDYAHFFQTPLHTSDSSY